MQEVQFLFQLAKKKYLNSLQVLVLNKNKNKVATLTIWE